MGTPAPTIIPGTRYGYLELTGKYIPGYRDGNKEIRGKVECKCDCGNIENKSLYELKYGSAKTCNIRCIYYSIFKHGQAISNKKTKEYKAWKNMKARCNNINTPSYKDYGGRGIIVSKEFEESFVVFYEYIGKAPTPQHSLDRIDNDKGYERGNLRWATSKEQTQNRRTVWKKEMEIESIKNENNFFRNLLQANNIQFGTVA